MRRFLTIFLAVAFALACSHKPGEKEPTKAALDRDLWSNLSKGMTEDKVREVLGEPIRVEKQEDVICWYYQEGPPLERNNESNRWVISRAASLFSAKGAATPKLRERRDP